MPGSRRRTPRGDEKEKLALKLLAKGKSAPEVAKDERIQVHFTTVYKWAKKNGIQPKVSYTREGMQKKEKQALKLLRKKRPAKQIAEYLKVHPSTVQRWAKKHGVKLRYPYNRHQEREDLVDVKEIIRLRKQTATIGGKKKPIFTLQEIADLCDCSRSYVKLVVAQARKDGKLP